MYVCISLSIYIYIYVYSEAVGSVRGRRPSPPSGAKCIKMVCHTRNMFNGNEFKQLAS